MNIIFNYKSINITMKSINNYINEALIKKDTKVEEYKYHPKTKNGLRSLLEKLIAERGKDADLNDIDTSEIDDMSWLFLILNPHNIDISEWDVSNVKNMSNMFDGCRDFNCDLSKWNVKNVRNMKGMFFLCDKFEGNGLSNWDVSKSTNTDAMFYECTSLKNKPAWYK